MAHKCDCKRKYALLLTEESEVILLKDDEVTTIIDALAEYYHLQGETKDSIEVTGNEYSILNSGEYSKYEIYRIAE